MHVFIIMYTFLSTKQSHFYLLKFIICDNLSKFVILSLSFSFTQYLLFKLPFLLLLSKSGWAITSRTYFPQSIIHLHFFTYPCYRSARARFFRPGSHGSNLGPVRPGPARAEKLKFWPKLRPARSKIQNLGPGPEWTIFFFLFRPGPLRFK